MRQTRYGTRDGVARGSDLKGTTPPPMIDVVMQNRNDDDDDGASVTDDSDYSTEHSHSDYEVAEWTSAADDDSGASSSGDVEEAVRSRRDAAWLRADWLVSCVHVRAG